MSKKLGLALGTGGARGWAHVGVIRALEEAGIKIDYIAGTSIGSLVGAIYVVGALERLEAFAEQADLSELMPLVNISFPGLGLINSDRVRDFIYEYVADKRLEEASIPFKCVSTNFLLKQEVVLQTGLMVDAVRASISIPGIFPPFQHDENVYLVDGGIINPLPISVVRDMGADVVVAVNLNQDATLEHNAIINQSNVTSSRSPNRQRGEGRSDNSAQAEDNKADTPQSNHQDGTDDNSVLAALSNRYDALKDVLQDQIDLWIPDSKTGINIFDVLGNSINVMEKRVTEVNLLVDKPEVLIEPDLSKFGTFDFQEAKTILPRGYEATKAMLPQIQELLENGAEDKN